MNESRIAEVVAECEAHVAKATGQHGSHTMQTRRVVGAMRAVGIARREFSVRTERDRRTGEYGRAIASIFTTGANDRVVENADAIAACGCNVTVIENATTGRKTAIVGSGNGTVRRITI